MATVEIPIGSIYRHKKEGYTVRVEKSAWFGKTQFRRVVPLNAKAGNPFRVKKTHYFVYEFEPSSVDGAPTREEDFVNALRAIVANPTEAAELAKEALAKYGQL